MWKDDIKALKNVKNEKATKGSVRGKIMCTCVKCRSVGLYRRQIQWIKC